MSASSNHLLADRRFAWAKGCTDAGDHAGAADLLEQVVDIAPDWAPGWAALAEARERAGDLAGARDAWGRATTLDPGGTLGAEVHAARLDGLSPDALPEPYVRALFDDYAPRFDRHLTGALAYRGPEVLRAALERAAPGRRFRRALDLGCGTGLMGLALADLTERVDGVDLSPAMAERARATGAYAAVVAEPLDAALAGAPAGGYDLVVAADVFVYIGDLAPVFAGAARALEPGGLLGFTAQALTGSDAAFRLGPDMRFGHAAPALERDLGAAGLTVLLLEPASTRREKGVPVPDLLAVAAR